MVDGLFFFANAGPGLSGVFSAAALALSGFAAWRANQQTVHLRREADAALGDLPPNLSLQRLATGAQDGRSIDTLLLLVENHNRRPICLRSLAIQEPKRTGVVAYRLHGAREELIGRMERKHDELETNILVPGTRPGAPAVSATSIKLVLVGPEGSSNKPNGQVAIKADYEILGPVPEPVSEVVKFCARKRRSSRRIAAGEGALYEASGSFPPASS